MTADKGRFDGCCFCGSEERERVPQGTERIRLVRGIDCECCDAVRSSFVGVTMIIRVY